MRTVPLPLQPYLLDYPHRLFQTSLVFHADCFEWMAKAPPASIHAIVTDPPYGVKEYDRDQLEKRDKRKGGTWRIPPAFDGRKRSPLPRFTARTSEEKIRIEQFFFEWGTLAKNLLRPGGHIFLASNSYLSPHVFYALRQAGLEFRGEIIRIVRTLRGGDRPKNAEKEFPHVCSLPRGCYEPWGLFRKPFSMTVAQCLRTHQTGGLRRLPNDKPFPDLIESKRTPQREVLIAHHPNIKPQSLLRQLVYTCLPLGEGIVLDPFMGSGSTIAAAESLGLYSIGIERISSYFEQSEEVIPQLAALQLSRSIT